MHSLVWEFKWEGMEWLEGNTHSSLFLQNLKFLFPSKLGGMRGNEIRFNDFFTKTPKIPLYIQPFILKYGHNSNIVIKWFHSIPSMLLPNKLTLDSIHFYSFLFLYFKISNRGYLISFHFFPFSYDHYIPFHSTL